MTNSRTIELETLHRKISNLVRKLKKQHNIQLEVFDHNNIEYGSIIGQGAEGVVNNCLVLYNNIPVHAAVKTLVNHSDDSLNITLAEIELLCLANDRIVPTTLLVFGIAAVPDKSDPLKGHLVIVTEVGIKNALQLYQDEAVPLHVTFDIWCRLSAALHCMHCKRIMHQDLKPENILITRIIRDAHERIDKVELRVIDLGMAQLVENEKIFTDDILGTMGYHAPEVLFDDCYDMRADIFVLGITFCVMLLPRSTLNKTVLEALLKKIHEAKEKGLVGRTLYESVIEPIVLSNRTVTISTAIKTMLCTMLEGVERRSITLLEIVRQCSNESKRHYSESRRDMTTRLTSECLTPVKPTAVARGRRRRSVASMTPGFSLKRRRPRRRNTLDSSNAMSVNSSRRDEKDTSEEDEEVDDEPVGRTTRSSLTLRTLQCSTPAAFSGTGKKPPRKRANYDL